jgi:outer membrane receptor protein involved in Fe transport
MAGRGAPASGLRLLATVSAAVLGVCTPALAAPAIAVPAEPVARAIIDFARQTGVQVLAAEEDLRGKVTAPVSGRYTPRQALQRMLAGTGLVIGTDDGRTITLRRGRAPAPRAARPRPPPRPAAPAPPQTHAQDTVSEVIITGSHLVRRGFDAPSPVTVVSAQAMEQLGITNAGMALNQLPSFRADLTPYSNGFANFNLGAVIANLRGLGAPRTLVLLDGHRFITSTREGSVDLNLIPTIMIDRTEIVTGGASAAYGSDAVAGAVNIILNTRLNGLKGQIGTGFTQRGDGGQFHVAAAGGTDFAGGRGHVVAGGEYEYDGKVGSCFTRDYCTNAGPALNVAGPTHDPTQPYNLIVARNYGYLYMTAGSVIPAIPSNPPELRNMQFNDAGNLIPYNPGIYQGGGFSVSTDNRTSLLDSNLAVPVKRYNFFSHLDYDLTPGIRAFVEGSYAYIDGVNVGNQTTDALIGIKRDNAFAPAELKAFFATHPEVARINIGRLGVDMGKLIGDSSATTWRVATGAKGNLNRDWRWNVSLDYGENKRIQSVDNNRVQANFYGPETNTTSLNYHAGGAVDAVVNPANGQIVCRSTIDPADPAYNPNSGCVPVNLFGVGRSSAAALAYVNRKNVTTLDFTQLDAAAAIQGRLFDTWAGPVDVGVGADYRRNTIAFINDPIGEQFGYYYNYGASYAGSVRVTELYGETQIPLLKDSDFAKALNLNLAGRKTWYHNTNDLTGASNRIGVSSWKVSLVYDPAMWLRFRFTRSRDIRAANFNELYVTSLATFGGIVNPWTNQTDFFTTISGGNVKLQPERGDTYTLGGVLRPSVDWMRGFSLSVDYYRITLKGAIGALSTTQIANDCYVNGPSAFSCSRITFQNGFGSTVTAINRTNQNQNVLSQSGVDIEALYRLPLERLSRSLPGELSLRVLASYVAHQISTAGAVTTDRAGVTGPFAQFGQVGTPGVPRWAVTGTVTYERGPFALTLQGRHISPGRFSASFIGPDDPAYSLTDPNSINDNIVRGRTYFNLAAHYDILDRDGRKVQLFGSVSNLFDKAPPLAPGLIGYSEPAFFDLIGRRFNLGARFDF